MILNLGEFRIESDSMQFILKEKRVIKESKFTKTENIGKEVFETVGYYRNLDTTLKAIGRQILLDNDDLKVIIEKLADLNKIIDTLTSNFEIHEVLENEEN